MTKAVGISLMLSGGWIVHYQIWRRIDYGYKITYGRDWVFNKHHGKNIRLTQYDFFTHTHNEFGEQELAPFAKPTFGRDLEPIALQRIHLIKNGFKVREYSDDTEFYYYDCYEINVSFDEGISEENIPPIIFLTIEFAEKDIAMPIEYVHELQQAMRLMGCDKEIEL